VVRDAIRDRILHSQSEMSSLALVVFAALAPSISIAGESPIFRVFDASNYTQIENLSRAEELLSWPDSRALVTLTDNASLARTTLCKPLCGVPTLILDVGNGSWPGNMYKILAFRAVAMGLPAKTLVFFTDCCDVLFLPSPVGAADVFDTFANNTVTNASSHLAGAEVVISVERGYSLLGSEALERVKLHDHSPDEFPDNPMEAEVGVPDVCDDTYKICLQSKFPNTGNVIGYARSLANMYDGACSMDSICKEWETTHGNVSLNLTSDQNVLSHYLLESNFSSGRIALDTDMALFHVTAGFKADEYSFRDGHMEVLLPWTSERVVLGASVVHVPNLNWEWPIDVMNKLEGLEPSTSVLSRLQELVAMSQSSSALKHRRGFLAGGRKTAKEGERPHHAVRPRALSLSD